jgi:hypothetical protein
MNGRQEEVYADILGTNTGWQVILPFQPAWLPKFAYGVGMVVAPRAGTTVAAYVCTADGVSGASEPVWPAIGNTVIDGGVTWRGVDPATGIDVRNTDRVFIDGHILEILDITAGQTWQTNTLVMCSERA